ncbi:extradiol ring-cleavage dioxygenase [Actinomadura barringtoniae]|uniref:Extradiol ring-cleavage dioxygenase n=1 Tax=Actinomadura barringtoniae TaxID=1427535 RepID=A0A939PH39_9ACTN|nr:extradiol ring-cleavage dioxygenase [Actinomadura barringtoniae]MBO2449988.1 extradiol ring-cleavage dioxygenase [Actinomadura barringtoniae]
MAEITGIYGVPHNPLLWRALRQDPLPDDLKAVAREFARLRSRLTETRPDTLLVISTDHLTQWFHDNMPAFLVGKAPEIPATFWAEEREFGIPPATLRGDAELGRALLTGGVARGVDFAASDEFRADHSVLIPLLYLRPELDLPIVCLFTNCMAPPLPPPERFYRVGEIVRQTLEESPLQRRIAVIASGHLATEVGGPRHFAGSPDTDFDAWSVGLLRKGAVEETLRSMTFERLLAAGNVSHQFLNFLVTMGVANGAPAMSASGEPSRFATSPFFEWSPR